MFIVISAHRSTNKSNFSYVRYFLAGTYHHNKHICIKHRIYLFIVIYINTYIYTYTYTHITINKKIQSNIYIYLFLLNKDKCSPTLQKPQLKKSTHHACNTLTCGAVHIEPAKGKCKWIDIEKSKSYISESIVYYVTL